MWTRAKPWTMHPGGFGLEFDDAARERLDKIDLLRRDIASPLALLSENGKKADTAAGQARVLADYLSAIRLPETLEERAAELESADHGLLAAEYSQLWDIIVRSLEQSAAILGDMPMPSMSHWLISAALCGGDEPVGHRGHARGKQHSG